MYKIMYKKFEGRVSRRPLNAGLRSRRQRFSAGRRDAGGACACTARRGRVSPGGARDG